MAKKVLIRGDHLEDLCIDWHILLKWFEGNRVEVGGMV
jgi:hypothetical protein